MRWLKFIASFIVIVALIAVIALILLVTVVNPNRFKPLITDQVKKTTGRDLTIDGDLSWTLFPSLGVKVGHLELSNPSDFKEKTFAEINSMTVSVKIMPLLKGHVKSSGISLNGLKLFLITNADGKTNWADLQNSSEKNTTPSSSTSMARAPMGLAVAGVDISNAVISWQNEKTKQYYDIQKFDFHAKDVSLLEPFPFSMSFEFSGKNPVISGQVSMTSNVSINLEKQMFILHDLDLSAKITKEAKTLDLAIKGDTALDLTRQTLEIDNFSGSLANIKMTGKMNINEMLTTPKAKGHVTIAPFDVKEFLQKTGLDTPALQRMTNLSGDFDFSASTTLQSANLTGSVKIDEIQASKVRISKMDIRTQLDKGVLTLSPISAIFYQGSLDGTAKINLNTAVPQFSVQGKLTNVQAEPLMNDLAADSKFKITGTGNIDFQATTAGTDGNTIVKNLNGTAKLNFNNGVLKGINIGNLLDSAYAVTKKQDMPTNSANETAFGTLTGTANIKNGVVTNNDFDLNAPRFEGHGKGTIDLPNKKINYQLQTSFKQADTTNQKNNLANLYGVSIPISISGNLDNPSIRLDPSALMKVIADQQLKKARKEVQDKIQDKIKGQIPGKAGELLNNLLGQ